MAASFCESTDGRTALHKLKFELIQAQKLAYNKEKILRKEFGGGGGKSMAKNGSLARLRRVKKAREAALTGERESMATSAVAGTTKSLRLNLRKPSSKLGSPKRSPNTRSPVAVKGSSSSSPMRVTAPPLPLPSATASISDALNMLPTFDKADSKKDYAPPKPKFSRPKKPKVSAPVKFAPVNWQANMETPRSPSSRAEEVR